MLSPYKMEGKYHEGISRLRGIRFRRVFRDGVFGFDRVALAAPSQFQGQVMRKFNFLFENAYGDTQCFISHSFEDATSQAWNFFRLKYRLQCVGIAVSDKHGNYVGHLRINDVFYPILQP